MMHNRLSTIVIVARTRTIIARTTTIIANALVLLLLPHGHANLRID
jgi:hypothetical protein